MPINDPLAAQLSRFARATVRRRLEVLAREIRRLIRRATPDAIHDVRVASRRLRAALRHWRPCFSAAGVREMNAAVRRLASLLGESRDLDVMLENLRAYPPRSPAWLADMQREIRRRRTATMRLALPEARLLGKHLPALRRALDR